MPLELSIYYIVFLLLSVIALLSITTQVKKYNIFLLFIFSIFLALFASLKTDYPDLDGYRTFFNEVAPLGKVLKGEHNYDKLYGIEWGYLFINSVIKFFSDSDIVMFVVIAFLTVGGVAYSCRRISPYPLLSILCYYSWFYYSALGGIRHALASSLVLLMIVALAESRVKLAVPIFLSAVSIHRSAAPTALLWFVKTVARRRFLLVLLLLAAIAISFRGGIGHDTATLALPFVDDTAQEKLLSYEQSSTWSVEESFSRGIIFKQLLLTLLSLYYMESLRRKFTAFHMALGAYMVSAIILMLFIDFKILSNRISHLFGISEIILIPMLFSLVPQQQKIIAFFILVICLFYQFSLLVGHDIQPYVSVLPGMLF